MKTEISSTELPSGLVTWSAYDDKIKTVVSSCAICHNHKLVLVDPIQAGEDIEADLIHLGTPTTIVLTNGNHERASLYWKEKFNIPVAASVLAIKELSFKPEIILEDARRLHELKPIPLPGGGPGETALYSELTRTMVVGDALTHLEESGLQLLPDTYCQDPAQNKQSVAKLLDYTFDTMLFAHGSPLCINPLGKLKTLLSQ